MIPCLPTYHLYIPSAYWKFIKNDTPTLNYFTSFNSTGGNRGSLMDAVIAYSGSTLDNLPGANVPMHPLSYSCFFHVTKIGT